MTAAEGLLNGAAAFFFDRISPTIISAARIVRDAGGLVVFEPSALRQTEFQQKAIELSHIVKVAAERLPDGKLPENLEMPPILVITEGAEGLTVSYNGGAEDRREKRMPLPSLPPTRIVDTAGAGDMVTAGLIHVLLENGWKNLSHDIVEKGLRYGQSLASLNCGFTGARGLFSALRELGVTGNADPMRFVSDLGSVPPIVGRRLSKEDIGDVLA